jgi:hypothetical protein
VLLQHPLGAGRLAGFRRHGRCTACGVKGVALQHPWGGNDVGWAMPIDRMAPMPE